MSAQQRACGCGIMGFGIENLAGLAMSLRGPFLEGGNACVEEFRVVDFTEEVGDLLVPSVQTQLHRHQHTRSITERIDTSAQLNSIARQQQQGSNIASRSSIASTQQQQQQ